MCTERSEPLTDVDLSHRGGVPRVDALGSPVRACSWPT